MAHSSAQDVFIALRAEDYVAARGAAAEGLDRSGWSEASVADERQVIATIYLHYADALCSMREADARRAIQRCVRAVTGGRAQ